MVRAPSYFQPEIDRAGHGKASRYKNIATLSFVFNEQPITSRKYHKKLQSLPCTEKNDKYYRPSFGKQLHVLSLFFSIRIKGIST
jgi:hypothetical protein